MADDPAFGPFKRVLKSVYEIDPDAMEDIAKLIEQRGLKTPIGQVVGYQRERFAALVERNSTQSINDSTETNLIFNVVTSDPQKAFDGTSTVKLPYNGLYFGFGMTAWAANVNGSRFHAIKQNGVVRAKDWRAATGTAAQGAESTIVGPILGVKGDSIVHSVFQDSGGALNVLAASSFAVVLVSAY